MVVVVLTAGRPPDPPGPASATDERDVVRDPRRSEVVRRVATSMSFSLVPPIKGREQSDKSPAGK